jgi:hypothetical protein
MDSKHFLFIIKILRNLMYHQNEGLLQFLLGSILLPEHVPRS